MARAIWKGVITFGMVSIPVKIYTATQCKDIAFNQLHKTCHSRIRYQKYCPQDDEVVENEDIVKGYEYSRGNYVVLTDEDFENLPLPSKHTIDVSEFVESQSIDPIYFEKAYLVEPEELAVRPFKLFMKVLEETQMVAIGSIALRQKEQLCSLRTFGENLLLETLLYADELRVEPESELPEVKLSEKEVKMAKQLVELMTQEFDPTKFKDRTREEMNKLIEAKLEGRELEPIPAAPRGKVIDLMETLRQSIESARELEPSEEKPVRKKVRQPSSQPRKRTTKARKTRHTKKIS